MVDPRLQDYVKTQLERGYSPEAIKAALLNAAYTEEDAAAVLPGKSKKLVLISILAFVFVIAVVVLVMLFRPAPETPPASVEGKIAPLPPVAPLPKVTPPLLEPKAELVQLLQKAAGLEAFDVTYSLSMVAAGESFAQLMVRQAKQGENQRIDFTGTVLGFPTTTSSFVLEGQQITCGQFDATWKCSPGEEVCMTTALGETCQSGSLEGIKRPAVSEEELAKAAVSKTGARELANITAQCYALSYTEEGKPVSSEYCLSQEGIVLLMRSEAEGFTATVEATSYSTTVAPDAFTLPAVVS